MITIGQIVDKDTKGLNYLENYIGDILNNNISTGVVLFEAELLEVINSMPTQYLSCVELSIDLDNLNGKTIRELLEQTL